MVLTTGHIIGIVSGLLLITAVGIYSGKKVKSEKDFAVGGRQASARLISGALMGTLVSGAATVGTAQLAFQFGFSAWWFTLGGGIALAVLGVFMARSFWESKVETLPQYLAKTYSPAIGPISTIFTSIGIYFSMMAQILAFTALMTSMFSLHPMVAASIGLLLTLAYVFFGGVWGAGMVGTIKLTLLYISSITCGAQHITLWAAGPDYRTTFQITIHGGPCLDVVLAKMRQPDFRCSSVFFPPRPISSILFQPRV